MYHMNKIIEWHKDYCEKFRQRMKLSYHGMYWISFIKGVLIVIVICMLTGCSVGEKRLKIFSVEEPRQKLNLPKPESLDLEKVRWIIITSKNADEVFAKLEAEGIDPVLFGLTDKDFEMIAKNFAQIRQKLQETNNLLEEYKKYYEGEDNADSN